jgi:hypothetical protein
MMKHQRTGIESCGDDFEDLDALVLAEIESLSGPPRSARPSAGGARPAPRPAARPAREHRDGPAPVAPIRRRAGAEPNRSGEEFDGLFDRPFPEGQGGPDPDDTGPVASLLSTEEEAFVTRAVGFLSQREHADMILGRIWEQLTELDPDGFYEAPVSAVSAQGTAEEAQAGETPPPTDGSKGSGP